MKKKYLLFFISKTNSYEIKDKVFFSFLLLSSVYIIFDFFKKKDNISKNKIKSKNLNLDDDLKRNDNFKNFNKDLKKNNNFKNENIIYNINDLVELNMINRKTAFNLEKIKEIDMTFHESITETLIFYKDNIKYFKQIINNINLIDSNVVNILKNLNEISITFKEKILDRLLDTLYYHFNFGWRTNFGDVINNIKSIDENLKSQLENIGKIDKSFKNKIIEEFLWIICRDIHAEIMKKNIFLINENIQNKWSIVKNNEEIIEVLLGNISRSDNNFQLLINNFSNIKKFIEENPFLKKNKINKNNNIIIVKI